MPDLKGRTTRSQTPTQKSLGQYEFAYWKVCMSVQGTSISKMVTLSPEHVISSCIFRTCEWCVCVCGKWWPTACPLWTHKSWQNQTNIGYDFLKMALTGTLGVYHFPEFTGGFIAVNMGLKSVKQVVKHGISPLPSAKHRDSGRFFGLGMKPVSRPLQVSTATKIPTISWPRNRVGRLEDVVYV